MYVLLLLAMAMAPITQPPSPEVADLYYYDEIGSRVALPITNKVFVTLDSEETDKWLAEKQLAVDLVSYKRKRIGGTDGFVVYFKDLRQTVACMKLLKDAEIPHVPIVSYDTVDCIPSNSIVCSVRFSVRPDARGESSSLAKRIKSSYDVDFFLRHIKGNKYVMDGIRTRNPSTVMGLANLMAEDTAWFEGARVVFIPVDDPVVAKMSIENPAGCDLGHTRNLVLTIKTFHGAAKVRKDMLPKLGQGNWFPTYGNGNAKEEIWYDFQDSTIKESLKDGVQTIQLVYPFRFFHNRACTIPPVQITYELDGEQFQCEATGVLYPVSSLLENTGITDIQPIEGQMSPLPKLALPEPVAELDNRWIHAGFAAITLGGSLLLMQLTWSVCLTLASFTESWRANIARRRTLEKLTSYESALTNMGDDWRSVYLQINRDFTNVLEQVYNKQGPQAAETTTDPLLRSVMLELEKVYQQKPELDTANLKVHLTSIVRRGVVI